MVLGEGAASVTAGCDVGMLGPAVGAVELAAPIAAAGAWGPVEDASAGGSVGAAFAVMVGCVAGAVLGADGAAPGVSGEVTAGGEAGVSVTGFCAEAVAESIGPRRPKVVASRVQDLIATDPIRARQYSLHRCSKFGGTCCNRVRLAEWLDRLR